MNTKEKILNLLEEKVDEIFLEMQNELGIDDGNIFPMDKLELDNSMEQLADKIKLVLDSQM
mgnify:CR=1 FL=1